MFILFQYICETSQELHKQIFFYKFLNVVGHVSEIKSDYIWINTRNVWDFFLGEGGGGGGGRQSNGAIHIR